MSFFRYSCPIMKEVEHLDENERDKNVIQK